MRLPGIIPEVLRADADALHRAAVAVRPHPQRSLAPVEAGRVSSLVDKEIAMAVLSMRRAAHELQLLQTEPAPRGTISLTDMRDRLLEGLQRARPEQGYVDAFYELAELMGVPAPQPASAREVWETQMLPRLRRAFQGSTN